MIWLAIRHTGSHMANDTYSAPSPETEVEPSDYFQVSLLIVKN